MQRILTVIIALLENSLPIVMITVSSYAVLQMLSCKEATLMLHEGVLNEAIQLISRFFLVFKVCAQCPDLSFQSMYCNVVQAWLKCSGCSTVKSWSARIYTICT